MEPEDPAEPEIRDLAGLEVGLAAQRAAAAGYEVCFVSTKPPWGGKGEGGTRVVRVRFTGPRLLELTVAREGWTRVGGEKP